MTLYLTLSLFSNFAWFPDFYSYTFAVALVSFVVPTAGLPFALHTFQTCFQVPVVKKNATRCMYVY